MNKLRVFTLVLALLIVSAGARTSYAQDSQKADTASDKVPKLDPPRVTRAPDPKYPKEARAAGHQGDALLSLVVGRDGRPHDIKVVRALDAQLDESAVAGVAKWRYRPAQKNGEPVEAAIHVRVVFRLHSKCCERIAELWDRSEKDDANADLQLWKAYKEGDGVPRNDQLAFEFLKMAADWNLSQAQLLMGEHYYKSHGGSPDYVNAYMWYALSKRAGGQEGEAMLKTLAAEMSEEQLAEADLRVDYWPEDPPKNPE